MNYRPRNQHAFRGLIKGALKITPGVYDLVKRLELVAQYFLRRPHEPDFLLFRKLKNRPGQFLDVGANVGQSAISFGALNGRMSIVSFEPNAACLPGLKLARRILGKRYTYHMVGIGAREERLTLHVPVTGGVAATQEASVSKEQLEQADVGERIGEAFTVRGVEVQMRTLDSFGYQPDIVKIDVQGHELDVLRGMTGTLAGRRPLFLIESGRHDADAAAFLAQYGYRPYFYSPDEDRLVPAGSDGGGPHVINTFYVADGTFPELVVGRGASSPQWSATGLLTSLWRRKGLIGAAALAGLLLAYWAVLSGTRQYTVTMAIGPSGIDAGAGDASSSLVGALSGAASFLGGSGGDSRMSEFFETIHSIDVATILMEDSRIVEQLFEDEWDAATKDWRPPGGFVNRVRRLYRDATRLPDWTPPSPYRLTRVLVAKLKKQATLDSAIKHLYVKDRDPQFGLYLLDRVTAVADDVIRARNESTLLQQQSYIKTHISQTLITDYRDYLLDLMSQNDKQLMRLASARPYSVTVVSKPYASDVPTSPAATLYLAMGLLGGFCMGCAWVIARFVLSADDGPSDGGATAR